jgi:hypothetical protein
VDWIGIDAGVPSDYREIDLAARMPIALATSAVRGKCMNSKDS